jgi:glutamine synthetase
MPKPIIDEVDGSITGGDNGSGMHASVSFRNNPNKSKDVSKKKDTSTNNNIFYDKDDTYAEISQAARYLIGGLIEHALSLAAFVTPTVNSYYRTYAQVSVVIIIIIILWLRRSFLQYISSAFVRQYYLQICHL